MLKQGAGCFVQSTNIFINLDYFCWKFEIFICMNIEELRDFCISIKGATESFPFIKKSILVFKVAGKMFCYVDLEPKEDFFRISMKCNPEKSAGLRERYEGVITGEHTRDLSWNAVYIEKDVPDSVIKELILHSVDEVIKKLPKKKREEYLNS